VVSSQWLWVIQEKEAKLMKPKVCLTRNKQIEHWIQCYLQAKVTGDTKQVKIYEALILKLEGKVPK
jgi:hypothetical protein